jgi:hypothetical protein
MILQTGFLQVILSSTASPIWLSHFAHGERLSNIKTDSANLQFAPGLYS